MNKPYRDTRILIVDDDPVSRLTMEQILKPEGYTVFAISSGVNILEVLSDCQPDVLLMDVLMPYVDGLELCRRIKADQHWQHLPIILVTTLNSRNQLVAGLDAGADEFISKPVNALELRARVRSMHRVKQRSDLLLGVAQMREDLAHMVIHDLRTPLTSCILRTDVTLRYLDMAPAGQPCYENGSEFSFRDSLTTIMEQLQVINSQVDDILFMAQADQSEVALKREPADLREIALRVIDDYYDLAQRDNITLEANLPAGTCACLIDKKLIYRLIGNLVSNALKFSPALSMVTLSVFQGENPGSWVIEVADEGSGIAPADRKRIFDRYAVAEAAVQENSGFGLGLAFCKMVAEAHDGTISLRDNQPRGAVFSVCI